MRATEPTMTVPEANAFLTGEGGFFETTTESIAGLEMTVVKNRMANLREMLAASANHGGGEGRYYLFDDGTQATFAENIATAAALGAGLRERYGIEPGDRVAILGANSPAWIQTFWATVQQGAIAVAMNGWWTGDEIRYGLELTTPKVLVADTRRLERLEGDPGIPVVVMEDELAELIELGTGASLSETPIAEDDPAAILFTSGTTGRPKGAITTHRNFLAYVSCAFMVGAREAVRFPASDDGPTDPPLRLAASPLFHISGLHAAAITAMASGMGSLWTTGRFDPEKVLRLTEEHRLTGWGGVTTQMWRIIEHPRFHEFDTSSVQSIGGGGSVWSPELLRACRAALPHATHTVSVGYGLTECAGLATGASDDVLRAHPDTVGYPIPTADVRILDDEDHEVPDGEIGNVCIKGPMVIPGYWDNPEATADTIRPGGWLRTGDFGHMADGMLFLASRRKDLIIRGGENIYPTEIENRIDEHPDVMEVAVIGVDHRELGQEVKAVVVPREGASLDGQQLGEWVAQTLATFKVPAHWEFQTDPLPRNATGKILKAVVAGDAENTFIEES
ncbi:MAG: fatty acid--CoA ligase [Acidimicrobiales bacterium]|nr:MAG: fatty acid--CoA ligase [Acidimicrobiales bacterium]